MTIRALTNEQSTNALATDDFTDCTALIGRTVPPGQTASGNYTVSHSSVGVYFNTAEVTVVDDEGNSAAEDVDASVAVTAVDEADQSLSFNVVVTGMTGDLAFRLILQQLMLPPVH